ncbi:hypothetical protein DTO164E3_7461 [Paecilomyces variotii]|nr:hypothetical protein DTO164E3_7461 [Paecilomyces variotii]KAJ9358996.1 hypothetical protein DTO280E4_4859 [Paecilomyces variotii]
MLPISDRINQQETTTQVKEGSERSILAYVLLRDKVLTNLTNSLYKGTNLPYQSTFYTTNPLYNELHYLAKMIRYIQVLLLYWEVLE